MTATSGPRTELVSVTKARRRPGNTLVRVSEVILVVLVLAAVLANVISPYPADALGAVNPVAALQPPSSAHWLGTDQVGRDVLTRVIFGARTSLGIVVAVLALAVVIGVTLGVIAGYFGGWLRDIIMRLTDVFLAFPSMLLALALVLVLRPSLQTAVLAIALTWWPWYTRLSAGVATAISSRTYMDATRALGVSPVRAIVRHVLPNSLTPVLVQLSLDAGGVILTAASLSFLGLGAQEPVPEWGLMVSQGMTLFTTDWWVALFPGLAILLTAFSFNMLGEGLRSALDPRRRAL
ncbi:ABC transporter permease [Microbacterium sp. 13-71-7]|uniref:ABC transporter permease n=1 Tax=Microbacterium sp. 13-71-7 TaxID=1970399 RepID=UPI000BD035F0|nr:ABC transporter permease [Microbacterium sp. 13-71-7]OZB85011.1 MAG: D-ala-D-ala transporter subunit [Microbacterium sp. 13-71-7]